MPSHICKNTFPMSSLCPFIFIIHIKSKIHNFIIETAYFNSMSPSLNRSQNRISDMLLLGDGGYTILLHLLGIPK